MLATTSMRPHFRLSPLLCNIGRKTLLFMKSLHIQVKLCINGLVLENVVAIE